MKREFVAADSIEEANLFARVVLGKDADYSGIALEFANEWNRCMLEAMESYPAAFERIKMVGSTQYCLDAQAAIYERALYDDNYEYNVVVNGVSEEEYAMFIKQQVTEYRMSLEPSANTMATSSLQQGLYEGTGGLFLNVSRMNEDNVADVKASLSAGLENNFHPCCCDTLKAVFDHEFGHILDDCLDLQNDTVIVRLFTDRTGQQLTEELSEYAWHNDTDSPISEFIAEAWSEYKNNPECRRLALQIGKRIEALYKIWEGKR